jgi:hypothetical protein
VCVVIGGSPEDGAQVRLAELVAPRTPSWGSISRVEELDRHRLRFAYQTRNADGNPSYTQ